MAKYGMSSEDRSEILASKNPNTMMKLSLVKYELEEEARAFGRPAGSHETFLMLGNRYGGGKLTNPKASWYLPEEVFMKLYEGIHSEKDFAEIDQKLAGINSEDDAKRFLEYLEAQAVVEK